MNIILIISNLIIPLMFFFIIVYGYSKKVDVYDAFVEGAKDGLKTVCNILPTLIGLMCAVSVLRASGALDILVYATEPLTSIVGFPAEIMPLALIRFISSSAATGIVLDLFKTFGPDSFIGRVASVMMGCTETIFYTMSVYFMSINIKETKHTLVCALIANIAGIVASFYLVEIIFGA